MAKHYSKEGLEAFRKEAYAQIDYLLRTVTFDPNTGVSEQAVGMIYKHDRPPHRPAAIEITVHTKKK